MGCQGVGRGVILGRRAGESLYQSDVKSKTFVLWNENERTGLRLPASVSFES